MEYLFDILNSLGTVLLFTIVFPFDSIAFLIYYCYRLHKFDRYVLCKYLVVSIYNYSILSLVIIYKKLYFVVNIESMAIPLIFLLLFIYMFCKYLIGKYVLHYNRNILIFWFIGQYVYASLFVALKIVCNETYFFVVACGLILYYVIKNKNHEE